MRIPVFNPVAVVILFLVSCQSSQASLQEFISFDGTKIAYTDEGNGEVVLLIHGFIVDGTYNWGKSELKKQLLDQGYRVIVPDLRGNGKSDKPQDENAYKDNAEIKDLMALINHLNAETYIAVGYSRGAIILANLLTKDNRITKAVFGGMGIHFTDPNWDRRLIFGDVFSGRIEPNDITQPAVDFAEDLGVDFKIMGYLQDHQPVTSVAELNNITIKTLVICGDEDLDNGNPKDFQKELPNSKLTLVKGDHMSTYNSSAFAEEIINFLNEE